MFILLGLLLTLFVSNACDYETATSDSVPTSPSVPDLLSESTSYSKDIDITSNYNLFRQNYASWAPTADVSDNSVEVRLDYSNAPNASTRAWQGVNATLFPSPDADGFFPIYNYYDHANVWHKLSFKFKQNGADGFNILADGRQNEYSVNVAIFDMSVLTWRYPNELGDVWTSTNNFGQRVWGGGGTNRSSFLLTVSQESKDAGVTQKLRNWVNETVWMTFPASTSTEWEDFEVTFQLDEFENMEGCETCFPAFYVSNNGHLKWNTNASYSFKDVKLERLSTAITYETPITDFYNELVTIPRMDSLETVEALGWARTDCPHERQNLYEWHDPSTWPSGVVPQPSDSNVTIPAGKSVIIRSCSLLGTEEDPYQRIWVPETSSLILDDGDIDFHFREIFVHGTLEVGSMTCRLYSDINFYFHGAYDDSSTDHDDHSEASKGIIGYGITNFHGKLFHPTWTKLAIPVYAGDDRIFLQESVNWEVGQEIVVVTSVWEDYPDNHQNERLTITAIGDSDWTTRNVLYFGGNRFEYNHYAGQEYQTEVLLLTRNIKFIGIESGDLFGGHTEVVGNGAGEFRGIEAINMGQQNVLARYPFHFHIAGTAEESIISDVSVHDSNFRCWTIHGTHNLTLERNVGYDINGHCLYIEDGIEEDNLIQFNAVAHVHPIGMAAGGSGCGGQVICTGCDDDWLTDDISNYADVDGSEDRFVFAERELIIPADTAASPFYISNAHNRFIGNIASGGWSGFAVINMRRPLGVYLNTGYITDDNLNPYVRPILQFDGNTAHSSGFYWDSCGSCVYGGGELFYDDDRDVYVYNTGKVAHKTKNPDGEDEWNIFTNTKTYLCNHGVNYWGQRARFENFEAYDNQRGMFMFGENVLRNGLIVGHSDNTLGDLSVGDPGDRDGYRVYDTVVKIFLQSVTFRNFDYDEPCITLTTGLDQFTPQGVFAVRGITYENVLDARFHIWDGHCGAPCNEREDVERTEKQASRNFAIYDYDGSASQTGKATIITTRREFWAVTGDCMFNDDMLMWFCPWYEYEEGNTWQWDANYHNIGFFDLYIDGLTDGTEVDGLDAIYEDPEHDGAVYNTIGYFSQFGRNYSTPYSYYPGVAGMTNTGWYFRSIYDSPASWSIGRRIQIPRKSFILLAMKYPSDTTFEVNIELLYNEELMEVKEAASFSEIAYTSEDVYDNSSLFYCHNYGSWQSICNETGGLGPAWYFDGSFFYLRVVNLEHYAYYSHATWMEDYFEHDGMRLWDIAYGYKYHVAASCDGCASTWPGFYDVDDSIPGKMRTQQWESTGYYDTGSGGGSSSSDDEFGTDNPLFWVVVIGSILGCILIVVGVVCVRHKFKSKNDKNVGFNVDSATPATGGTSGTLGRPQTNLAPSNSVTPMYVQ